MCGRARQNLSADAVAQHARRVAPTSQWVNRDRYTPTPNLHPGRDAAVLACSAGGGLSLRCMRWGLVPAGAKERAPPHPLHEDEHGARVAHEQHGGPLALGDSYKRGPAAGGG